MFPDNSIRFGDGEIRGIELINPSHVGMVGDLHSLLDKAFHIIWTASVLGLTTLVVVGDLESRDNARGDVTFMMKTSDYARKFGIVIIYVDGNHDRHSFLFDRVDGHYDQFLRVQEQIWYAPRGMRWTWQDRRFLALGGAYSIDQEEQTRRMVYDRRELITTEDVQRCIAGGPADVLISHDVAWGYFNLVYAHQIAGRKWTRDDPTTQANRQFITDVIEACGITIACSGHYHIPLQERADRRMFVGLGANAEPGSLKVMKLAAEPVAFETVRILGSPDVPR